MTTQPRRTASARRVAHITGAGLPHIFDALEAQVEAHICDVQTMGRLNLSRAATAALSADCVETIRFALALQREVGAEIDAQRRAARKRAA